MPRPPVVTRAQVLDAALALADAEGVRAVTMRAVAERVGVTPMALYRHVGDRQALQDGLVELLLAEVVLPDADADWVQQLRHLVREVLAVARRHPGVFPLVLQRPVVTPAALRVVEANFAMLRRAGVRPADVPAADRMVGTYVLGYAASEAGGRFGPGTRSPGERLAALDPEDFPEHHALAEHLGRRDPDAELERSVELLEVWIRRLAAAR